MNKLSFERETRNQLEEALDKNILENLKVVNVDELAPRFATVIVSQVEKDINYLYKDPSYVLSLTVLTPSYREVLQNINALLYQRSCGSFLLNFDMGTGKTHLLTLLFHLYGVCSRAPQMCIGKLPELENQDLYNRELAKDTVVLAFDLREPGNIFTKQILFFARQLREIGATKAAEIVERAAQANVAPNAWELAEAIPSNVHILVLADELHHALIHASGTERERLSSFVDFLTHFMDYRRTYSDARKSAFIIILASARRDLEEWERAKKFEEYSPLAVKVDSLINQLERVRVTTKGDWLKVEEAKDIIAKRLQLKSSFDSVFYGFDEFLTRVLKEDTDIPQAHHLRSLIKAMAIYALNALDMGDPIVTPAHLSEEIISAMFLGSQLEAKYRSLYGEIIGKTNHDIKLIYGVNAIFTASMTGDTGKLIEMLKYHIAKVEKGKEHVAKSSAIPMISAKQLEDILEKLGLSVEERRNVLEMLDGKLDVHISSIRTPEGYFYFVIPAASPVSLFKHTVVQQERNFLANKNIIINKLMEVYSQLRTSENLVIVQQFSEIDQLERFNFKEDYLYVLLYTTVENLLKEDFKNKILNDAEKFLRSKQKFNIVLAFPIISENTLNLAAYYLAVHNAVSLTLDYILTLENSSLDVSSRRASEEDNIFRQLVHLQEDELITTMGRYYTDACSSLMSAVSSYLLMWYKRSGEVARQEVKLTVEKVNVNFPRDKTKILQSLSSYTDTGLVSIGEEIASKAKEFVKFLDDPSKAANVIAREIENEVKNSGKATIYDDMRYFQEFYVPAPVLERAKNITKQLLKEKYGNVEWEEKSTKGVSSISVSIPVLAPKKEEIKVEPVTVPYQPALSVPGVRKIDVPREGIDAEGLVNAISNIGGKKTVIIELEVPETETSMFKNLVYALKSFIRHWRIKAEQ